LDSKFSKEEDFHRWLTLIQLGPREEGRDDASMKDWINKLAPIGLCHEEGLKSKGEALLSDSVQLIALSTIPPVITK
jgi:hypothetical protein